jgi:hypothetical protein
MAWYLENVRVFPQTASEEWDQLIAELNPLGGGSIYHQFGYSDEKQNVNAYIVSNEDKAAIRAMVSGGQLVTLSGPYGTEDFYLKAASIEYVNRVICQTFHPGKNETDPVFVVDLEFWKDE